MLNLFLTVLSATASWDEVKRPSKENGCTDIAQLVECLPCIRKTLVSMPRTQGRGLGKKPGCIHIVKYPKRIYK